MPLTSSGLRKVGAHLDDSAMLTRAVYHRWVWADTPRPSTGAGGHQTKLGARESDEAAEPVV